MSYVQGTTGDKVIMINSLQWDHYQLHKGDHACAGGLKSL